MEATHPKNAPLTLEAGQYKNSRVSTALKKGRKPKQKQKKQTKGRKKKHTHTVDFAHLDAGQYKHSALGLLDFQPVPRVPLPQRPMRTTAAACITNPLLQPPFFGCTYHHGKPRLPHHRFDWRRWLTTVRPPQQSIQKLLQLFRTQQHQHRSRASARNPRMAPPSEHGPTAPLRIELPRVLVHGWSCRSRTRIVFPMASVRPPAPPRLHGPSPHTLRPAFMPRLPRGPTERAMPPARVPSAAATPDTAQQSEHAHSRDHGSTATTRAHVILCCPRLLLIDPANAELDEAWQELPDYRHLAWAPVHQPSTNTWHPEWVCLRCNAPGWGKAVAPSNNWSLEQPSHGFPTLGSIGAKSTGSLPDPVATHRPHPNDPPTHSNDQPPAISANRSLPSRTSHPSGVPRTFRHPRTLILGVRPNHPTGWIHTSHSSRDAPPSLSGGTRRFSHSNARRPVAGTTTSATTLPRSSATTRSSNSPTQPPPPPSQPQCGQRTDGRSHIQAQWTNHRLRTALSSLDDIDLPAT